MLPGLEHLQLVWSGEGAVLDMLEERALKSVVIGIWEGGELRPDAMSHINIHRGRDTKVALW